MANPFAYEEYRKDKIRQKIEESRTQRVQVKVRGPGTKSRLFPLVVTASEERLCLCFPAQHRQKNIFLDFSHFLTSLANSSDVEMHHVQSKMYLSDWLLPVKLGKDS